MNILYIHIKPINFRGDESEQNGDRDMHDERQSIIVISQLSSLTGRI